MNFAIHNFSPKCDSRPLKPIRVPRSTVTVKDVEEVSILVSVVRAYDVPIRRELDKGGNSHIFVQLVRASAETIPHKRES